MLAVTGYAVAQASPFRLITSYRGVGGYLGGAIANTAGGRRVYLSYVYEHGTFDLVSVDPATGKALAFTAPLPALWGAVPTVGPDGNIYLGTRPSAHLLEFDVTRQRYFDLGKIGSERYVFDIATGPDGMVYAGTYPSADLVRINPVTKAVTNLGRMDPTEQYVRSIVSDGANSLYLGIGYMHAQIIKYNVHTGTSQALLQPADMVAGQAPVLFRGKAGGLYAQIGTTYLRVNASSVSHITRLTFYSEAEPLRLRGNVAYESTAKDKIFVHEDNTANIVVELMVENEQRWQLVRFKYSGESLQVWRFALLGKYLYGGTDFPFYLFRIETNSGATSNYGIYGGGEPHSVLAHGGRILMAAYGCYLAPLMIVAPNLPIAVNSGNPQGGVCAACHVDWRPKAIAATGNPSVVFVGADNGYGLQGGQLFRWDLKTDTAVSLGEIVPRQSVTSLAVVGGLLVGGTNVQGGEGSVNDTGDAHIFVWDIAAGKLAQPVLDVPNAKGITDLVTLPNGYVFGVAGSTTFIFDPQHAALVARTPASLFVANSAYNTATLGPDGAVWGLDQSGIFRADPSTGQSIIVAKAPAAITGGIATSNTELFFAANNNVYAYRFPPLPGAARRR